MRTYIAIDLKSFYASVECADRKYDPLTTNLVVADASRTEKTICLAVSPSLKAYGISGRARLFEVVQRVKEINAERFRKIVNGVESKNIAPQAVAGKAVRALSAKKPRYVYNINRNPLLRILNIMPAGLQTRVIGKILR